MSDRSVLPELIRSLSEQERRRLLKKLQGSINIDSSEEESIYHKEIEKDERELLIENDLKRVGLFTRFRLWLRRLFTGKDTKELFVSLKLGQLRNSVQQKARGLVGFDTRSLQPEFGMAFFELYAAVLPLIRLYRHLWSESKNFEQAILGLLEKNIPERKSKIHDFMTTDEMEKVYLETSSKAELRDVLLKRLETYVQNIPEEVFSETVKIIQPVYYLREVALFPHTDFFKLFKVVYNKNDEPPTFKTAAAGLALEFLEKMYYAIYLVTKIDKKFDIDKYFINDICTQTNKESEDPCADLKEKDFNQIALEIINAAGDLRGKIPLVELIRYFREDPYYQLIFYIPKLHLREFYISKIKLDILPNIDDIFPEIRKTVIEKRIKELFPGKRPEPLLYYRDYASFDYQKLGLPTFAHTRSINLMYNFIITHYRKKIQQVIQILSQTVLKQNRITLNRLLMNSAAIEDLQDKIKAFDNSLSPDEDDGKLFQRIRNSIGNDPSHQRLYRSLLQQKDNEVKSLMEKGKESFLGIKQIFTEYLSSPMEEISQKLNTHYYIDGGSKTLRAVLKQRSEQIEKFRNLLFEVSKIERNV